MDFRAALRRRLQPQSESCPSSTVGGDNPPEPLFFCMSVLQRDPIPAILLSLAASYLAYDHLPDRVPVHWDAFGRIDAELHKRIGVLLHPGAMTFVYIFFRLIPFVDRNRVRQLKEIGLYDPFRNGAVLLFGYSHLLLLGIGLGWVDRGANLFAGLLSLSSILAGNHLKHLRSAWFDRILGRIGVSSAPHARNFACNILIFCGALGQAGAATASLQVAWFLLPLAVGCFLVRRRFPVNRKPAP